MTPQRHKGRKKKSKRQRLLARVHILAGEIWPGDRERADNMRRELMMYNFGARSATALDEQELEELVAMLASRLKGQGSKLKGRTKDARLEELLSQARATARELGWEDRRLRGLCRKTCGVDRVEWVREIKKLTALVAALERYLRREFSRRAGEPVSR